jgi:hypothetical protein
MYRAPQVRVYYWTDPKQQIHERVEDADLRMQHPEIDDAEWRRLFAEAFDRGEREYLKELQGQHPAWFTSEAGRQAAFVGYTWGPCDPSPETLAELGLTETDYEPLRQQSATPREEREAA